MHALTNSALFFSLSTVTMSGNLSLKVVMNKEKTKVLFAEANSDFINVLLSFLALPLGKLVTILSESYGAATVPGSLNTLYAGVSNLDETYFCSRNAKQMLLNPQSSCRADFCELALDICNSPQSYFFVCPKPDCRRLGKKHDFSYSAGLATCDCGKSLSLLYLVDDETLGDGGFTVSPLSFIVTDDLRVAPIVIGTIRTLCNLGITDTPGAEIMFSSFGVDEFKNLLKLALTSATPLTDMILKKDGSSSAAAKPEPGILLRNIQKNNSESRKMTLKVCLQKSTNKFLFVEAMDDFVDFLFSFLVVPLGDVEFLLGGNTGLTNIDNLYGSASNGIDKKYFMTEDTKARLINPNLPFGFIWKNQFLPLSEDSPPILYKRMQWNGYQYIKTGFSKKDEKLVSSFEWSEEELYVKKHTMCFVKDDLTVCPSLATSVSILDSFGIPLSDVKDVELQIGMEEALGILKASLTSKTPLTDALVNPLLNKLPKLERKIKQEA